MVEEKDTLQVQAPAEEEKVFPVAPTAPDGRFWIFMEKLRGKWDHIAYQSTVGIWCIKIVSTLVVFLSLLASVRFGLAASGSLVREAFALLPETLGNEPWFVLLAELLISLAWLAVPMVGVPLCAALLYMCYGGMAPIVLLLAFVLLLFFQFEDHPVSALMIALPALTLLTSLHVGIFVVVLAAFASTRKHNGTVRSLGMVYFALLELCVGTFGGVRNSRGVCIVPTDGNTVQPLSRLKYYYSMLETGNISDPVFGKLLLALAIFFVVGLVFAKLLNLRYAGKARRFIKDMQIDVKDGIICAILCVLLCLLPTAVVRCTMLSEFGYGYGSMLLQVLAAYLLSRPFAGLSPNRGDSVVGREKNFIFISYAHKDFDRINPCLKILRKNGYESWYDAGIETGAQWQETIASNLANCTCVLAFVSKDSIQSDYCLKEIKYATSMKKPMAVVLLDEVKLPPVLEMLLASLQAVHRAQCSSDEECMQKAFMLEQFENCKY